MEVGQGPNWGCSTKGKKKIKERIHTISVKMNSMYVYLKFDVELSFH
jgi:hypothetical protein